MKKILCAILLIITLLFCIGDVKASPASITFNGNYTDTGVSCGNNCISGGNISQMHATGSDGKGYNVFCARARSNWYIGKPVTKATGTRDNVQFVCDHVGDSYTDFQQALWTELNGSQLMENWTCTSGDTAWKGYICPNGQDPKDNQTGCTFTNEVSESNANITLTQDTTAFGYNKDRNIYYAIIRVQNNADVPYNFSVDMTGATGAYFTDIDDKVIEGSTKANPLYLKVAGENVSGNLKATVTITPAEGTGIYSEGQTTSTLTAYPVYEGQGMALLETTKSKQSKPITGGTLKFEKGVGSLEIIKVSYDNDEPLEGAIFQLFESDGTTPATFATGSLVGELTSGKDGKIKVDNLNAGSYVLKEIKAPQGYQVGADKNITITVEKTTEVKVVNTPNTIIVSKKDLTTKAELEGATLAIYNLDGTLAKDIITGEDLLWISSTTAKEIHLAAGEYILKETIAPSASQECLASLQEGVDKSACNYKTIDSQLQFKVNEDGTLLLLAGDNKYYSVESNKITVYNEKSPTIFVPDTGVFISASSILLGLTSIYVGYRIIKNKKRVEAF